MRAAIRRSAHELDALLRHYVGRPTPLYEASRLAGAERPRAHLPQARRPDPHRRAQDQQRARPGAARRAHGQDARRGGDRRGTARRGHGHGLRAARARRATSTWARRTWSGRRPTCFGWSCSARRCGASMRAAARSRTPSTRRCATGSTNVGDTYYLLGSVLGPHPYPLMVREFQSVIGREATGADASQAAGRLPTAVVACVGGGSNAIGIFDAFIDDPDVRLVGVEAGGHGITPGPACGALRRRQRRRPAGHAHLRAAGRRTATSSRRTRFPPASTTPRSVPSTRGCAIAGAPSTPWVDDRAALDAFKELRAARGDPARARVVARDRVTACRRGRELGRGRRILVNLSGRGDKDCAERDARVRGTAVTVTDQRRYVAHVAARAYVRAVSGRSGRTGLVTYVTAGDPDLERSGQMLLALDAAGRRRARGRRAVLGPARRRSRDPARDGTRAGGRHHAAAVLDLVASVRASIAAPIVLFTYANPLVRMGVRGVRHARRGGRCGRRAHARSAGRGGR